MSAPKPLAQSETGPMTANQGGLGQPDTSSHRHVNFSLFRGNAGAPQRKPKAACPALRRQQ
jgi:hypothetical protein